MKLKCILRTYCQLKIIVIHIRKTSAKNKEINRVLIRKLLSSVATCPVVGTPFQGVTPRVRPIPSNTEGESLPSSLPSLSPFLCRSESIKSRVTRKRRIDHGRLDWKGCHKQTRTQARSREIKLPGSLPAFFALLRAPHNHKVRHN